MKNLILSAILSAATLINPLAMAEENTTEEVDSNSPFSLYGEYVRFIPEDAEDTQCSNPNSSIACGKIRTGNGFRAGASYAFADFPIEVEASLLLASGEVQVGSSISSLQDSGDWEYTAKMIGVRFSPNIGRDFHISLGSGVNFADVSFDEFAISDDDSTEAYWTAFVGWRFVHASWWHSDGDNALGAGMTIRL